MNAITRRRRGGAPLIMALEPRLMFDGAAAVDAVDKGVAADKAVAEAAAKTTAPAAENTAKAPTETPASPVTVAVAAAPATDPAGARHEVVVVDTSVADWQTLVAGMNPNIPLILLVPGKDGIGELEQMAGALSQYHDLDAIHLVAEGRTGGIILGHEVLHEGALDAASPLLRQIGAALKPGGDVMLYSCSVAGGEAGKAFVDDLARAMGDVDIAASSDRTGPTELGGDWDLEYHTGTVDTVLPFTLQGMQDINHCLGCNFGVPLNAQGLAQVQTWAIWSWMDHSYTMTGIYNGSTLVGVQNQGATYTRWYNQTTGWGDSNGFASANGCNGPSVSSINRHAGASTTTNVTSEVFDVTFSAAVTGVSASNFTATTTGSVTNGGITVSGSGTAWTVTVNGVGGDGTLGLNLSSVASITAVSGGAALGATKTGDQTYTIDNTAPGAPTVAISADTGSNTTDGYTRTAGQTVTVTAEGGATLDIDYGDGSAHGSASGAHTFATGKYTISVTATDEAGNTSSAGTKVIVVDLAAPTDITASATSVTVSAATNGATVATLGATDATSITDYTDSWTYAVTGGADQGKFQIASGNQLTINNTGGLSAGSYAVQVTATDLAGNSYAKTLNLTVVAGPTFTSGATAAIAENTATGTVVYTAAAAASSGSATWNALGGADAAYFDFDTGTGALTFKNVPDFETKNSFALVFSATDANATTTKNVTVTVTDLNDTAPVITSNGGGATAAINVAENATAATTVTSTDVDTVGTVTYSLGGGADSALFAIDANTGALTFTSGRNREAATDSDANHTYVVVVNASDGVQTDTQTVTVTVTDVNEFTPAITSNGSGNTAAISIAENTSAVTTVAAGDADATASLTYSLAGGADQAKFTINAATGALALQAAPDFETPTDAGDTAGNNTYVVVVRASDGTNSADQTVTVTVTDVDEVAPHAPTLAGPGTTTRTSVPVNGTAEANSTVKVYEGTTLLATVTADGTGAWTATVTLALGPHTLTATATDATGNVSTASAPAIVTVLAEAVGGQHPTGEGGQSDGPGDDGGRKDGPGDGAFRPDPGSDTLKTIVRETKDDNGTNDSTHSFAIGMAQQNLGGETGQGPRTGGDSGGSTFSAVGGQGSVPIIPSALTVSSGNSFQIAVAAKPAGGGDALVVNAPVRDAVVAEGSRIAVTIPAEAFAHTKADATVRLSATRADGAALPGWMTFNPKTGTFEGTPPPGFKGEVVVKVVARDKEGREAVQTFKIVVGEAGQGNAAPDGSREGGQAAEPRQGVDPAAAPLQRNGGERQAAKPVGRASLTEQLRAMSPESRLAKQMALFGVKRGSKVA